LTAIAIIVISAVVGSTFFRDISEAGEGSRLFFGVLSLVPGVLTAVQKPLQLSEHAEKHTLAAQRYRGLRRGMEATLATPRQGRGEPHVVFQQLQREFEKIEPEPYTKEDFLRLYENADWSEGYGNQQKVAALETSQLTCSRI
jgi:hypothetical protein